MAKRKTRVEHAEIVKRFATSLRELRHSCGLTQADLAEQAQVALSYLSKLESGGAAPGIDLVERLAVALGAETTDLLPTVGPPETVKILRDRAKQLFEKLLHEADRETLLMLNPLLARLGESRMRNR